jgi:hypothetical protein
MSKRGTNENSLKNLKHYQKGFDPNRNYAGAPRKLVSQIAEIGYTNSQLCDTIKNIAALTENEVKQIVDNEECTMFERMIAKAMIKDFSKSSLWNLEIVINRAFGKPKETQAVENTGKIEVVFVEGKTIL